MSKYGYSGLSANTNVQLPANYLVTNDNRSELNIFVLVPGSQKEMIEIAKHVYYSRVNIFIPSLEDKFVNTAFEIFKGVYLIKKTQCIFPAKPTILTNVMFEINFNMVKKYISPYSDISVEYLYATPSGGIVDFYDWYIRTGDRNIILSPYMTYDKLNAWYNNDIIDEIHMEYNDTLYSGLTYKTISQDYSKYKLYKNRLHTCKFIDENEFNEAVKFAEKSQVCIGFSVPNMF